MAERPKRKHGLWWWADRWRKSSAFVEMTLAEQGAYRNLLDYQRLNGDLLPNDERVLAKACGDPLEWPAVRDKVLRWFEPTPDGRFLFNRTAAEVNAETDRLSAAAAVGGKARAEGADRDGGKFTSGTTSNSTSGEPSRKPASVVRSPLPLSVTGSESEKVDETRARPANPLVNRDALVDEGHGLIRAIARLADLDPTEVLSKASRWRGNSYVRLDVIPDDRMAHTLEALRRWHRSLTGKSEPGPPTDAARASPRAQERRAGMEAVIMGGLRGRQGVGGRDGGTAGELPVSGPGSGSPDEAGRGLPPGARDPE